MKKMLLQFLRMTIPLPLRKWGMGVLRGNRNLSKINAWIGRSKPYQWDKDLYNDSLKKLLEKGKEINSSLIYDGCTFSTYLRVIHQYMSAMPSKTLEIGPGKSLGASVMMLLSGVQEAHTADPFPHLNFDLGDFLEGLKEMMDASFFIPQLLGKMDLKFAEGRFQDISWSDQIIPLGKQIEPNLFQIGEKKIRHFPGSFLEETGLESNAYDFIFSHATLEHVRNPKQCIQEIFRLLKAGGISAHQIDLRDHRDFSQPLAFLKESDSSWQTLMKKTCKYDGSLYLNRWRKSEWLEGFSGEGFEILEGKTTVKAEELPPEKNRDEKYKNLSREDLESLDLFIVVRKKSL